MRIEDRTDADLIESAYLMTLRTREVIQNEGHAYLKRFFEVNEPAAVLDILKELRRRNAS